MEDETERGRKAGWPEQLCRVVSRSCPVRSSYEEQKGSQKGH